MPANPAEIWLERLDRAGELTAPAVRDLYYELLDVDEFESSDREQRLWSEIGRKLGIGCRPTTCSSPGPTSPS